MISSDRRAQAAITPENQTPGRNPSEFSARTLIGGKKVARR